MVIKPYTKFDEPGIEFGLTYFDDPGVNIPSAVTSWVAMSGERRRRKKLLFHFFDQFNDSINRSSGFLMPHEKSDVGLPEQKIFGIDFGERRRDGGSFGGFGNWR